MVRWFKNSIEYSMKFNSFYEKFTKFLTKYTTIPSYFGISVMVRISKQNKNLKKKTIKFLVNKYQCDNFPQMHIPPLILNYYCISFCGAIINTCSIFCCLQLIDNCHSIVSYSLIYFQCLENKLPMELHNLRPFSLTYISLNLRPCGLFF